MNLKADPKRVGNRGETGIYVRAELKGKWESVDIIDLERDSLLEFLRSRGGKNLWAENIVAILLGHEPFRASSAPPVCDCN
jgi:hypothetical protein